MASVSRWIGRVLLGLVGILCVAAVAIYFMGERYLARTYPFREVAVTLPTDSASLARGAHLTRVTCAGCHGEQLNGHVMYEDGVFARFVAPGISEVLPAYTDAQLAGYIRYGVRPDGVSPFIMSPGGLYHLSDADLAAVIAHLRRTAIPPGEPLGRTVLKPIAKALVAFGLFPVSVHERDTTIARVGADSAIHGPRMGEYLARVSCADCHGAALTGSTNGPAPAPALANAVGYSLAEFTALIREGTPREDGKAIPEMTSVSRSTFTHLTDAEIAALHAYLSQLPASGITLR
ncbi:MAG: c-type cytochrome [Gemmatimonadetes bacterium]|nr:c-type cytochrome [Gemmatimonadota bacterium]